METQAVVFVCAVRKWLTNRKVMAIRWRIRSQRHAMLCWWA